MYQLKMMKNSIKAKLKQSPRLKRFILYFITSNRNPKPRYWVRIFLNPFFHKRGKGSIIRFKRSRIDVFPWHQFNIGRNTIIEDFTVVNNGAGDINIGDYSRIGIGSVIIGPVQLGSKVGLGQHVFISGFNHGYDDGDRDSNEQDLVIKPVFIDDETHIGSNSVILPGVRLGKRVQVGAGSVVTKSVSDFCLVVGNPATVIRKYDIETKQWIKVKN